MTAAATRPATTGSGALTALPRFIAALRRVSWFAAVGQALDDDERHDATRYLAALGFPECPLVAATDWRAAEAATRDPDWDPKWWAAEENARAALLAAAGKLHGRHALMTALSRVTLEASDVAMGAAAVAAARTGIADPALARVAAGAAAQAAYQAALALTAGADSDHPFAIKYRLFAAGHWPLGLGGGRLRIF
ncbi:MAG: hypothetical protein HY057_05545 [Rhodospirillales bacterium]|nr:hypothetical protein [Rhodospirillales bacterium]